MDYILDAHVLLWSIFDSSKLSKAARKVLLDKEYRKFISISTMWEISIKNRIGKLMLPDDLQGVYAEVQANGFGVVGVDVECVEIYNKLPLFHRGPFDGIIIATALKENMTIITGDENIQKYEAPWIW